jgi:hypothetical protein
LVDHIRNRNLQRAMVEVLQPGKGDRFRHYDHPKTQFAKS